MGRLLVRGSRSGSVGDLVDIGRRTLQQRDRFRHLAERRGAADRRGAASHQHHVLAFEGAAVVEVEGMDQLAGELLLVGKARYVGLGEIAVAVDEELRREAAVVGMQGPAPGVRVEFGGRDQRVEADALQDLELLGDRAQVAVDLLAAVQALRRDMRPEAVRILDEVGVAARAVPALRVPDAAQVLVGLQHEVGNVAVAQVIGGADAGDTGADHDGGVVSFHWWLPWRKRATRRPAIPAGDAYESHWSRRSTNASPPRTASAISWRTE